MKKAIDILNSLPNISEEENMAIDTLADLVVIRLEKNMSQKEIAKKMNISQARVAAIESVESTPTLKTLAKYADALGVRIDMRISDKETVLA